MAMTPEEMRQFATVLRDILNEGTTRTTSRTRTSVNEEAPIDTNVSQVDLDKIKKDTEERIKNEKELYGLKQKSVEIQTEILNGIGKQKNKLKSLLQNQKNVNDGSEEHKKNIEEITKKLKEANKEYEKQKKYIETLEQINSKIKDIKQNLMGSLEEYTKSWLGNFMSPGAYIEGFKNLDKMQAQLAKTTGWGRQFQKQIADVSIAMTEFGKTPEEVQNSFKSLTTTLTGFSQENKTTQNELVKSALQLENLGQSSEATGKNVSTLNAVLGMTNDKAIELQQELGNASKTLGMTVTEINDKFIGNMNRLSLYGQGAKDQFVRLQAFAKGTNMEVSSLLDVTEKLSTFEGSAEFAGRLNALAGQDLFDVTKLTMLEGQDKIDYIVEQLKGSGFDLDDPKMMRAVQQASGMDSNTFRTMMNAKLGKTQNLAEKAKEDMIKDPVKSAETKAKEATTLEEQKRAIILASQNKILTDWFKSYQTVSSYINNIMKYVADSFKGYGFAVYGLVAALGLAVFKARKLFSFGGGKLLEGVQRLLTGREKSKTSGEAGTPAEILADKIKGALGGGKEKDCIAICEDSLQKLANMIGRSEGESLFEGMETPEGKDGKGKKNKKGKTPKSDVPKAERQRMRARTPRTPRASRTPTIPTGATGGFLSRFAGKAGGFFKGAGSILGKAGSSIGGAIKTAGGVAGSILGKTGKLLTGGIEGLVSKAFPRLFKLLPGIGALISAAMTLGPTIMDASEAAKTGIDTEKSKIDIGRQLLSSIAGAGAGLLTAAIPGIGPFIAPFGGMAGEWLANYIQEKMDYQPKRLGEFFIDMFKDGENSPKAQPTGDFQSSKDRFYSGPEGTKIFSPKDHIFAGVNGSFRDVVGSGGSSKEEMELMKQQNALLAKMVKYMEDGKNPFFSTNEFSTRNMRAT